MGNQNASTALCIVHPHLIFGYEQKDVSGRFRRVAQNIACVLTQSREHALYPIAHTWMTDYQSQNDPTYCLRKLRGTDHAIMKGCIPRKGEFVFMSPKTSAVHVMRSWLTDISGAGINRIVLAGYYADACVRDHAHALLRRDFKVAVITDATTGYIEGSAEKAFAEMYLAGIELTTKDSYCLGLKIAKTISSSGQEQPLSIMPRW